jgi:hypothetical protein
VEADPLVQRGDVEAGARVDQLAHVAEGRTVNTAIEAVEAGVAFGDLLELIDVAPHEVLRIQRCAAAHHLQNNLQRRILW